MSQTHLPRHQRPTKLDTFLFGVPYYPEHWTAEERRDDPARMAAAGVNVVRMAEFAWDRMEPASGKFDFSLFDDTIARLGQVGIKTILCTPTATPPRWLTVQHPDWMRVDENGRAMEHGTRQHCCTNNEAFRAQSRRITEAMARHYAGNANVIGWQTDNEFHCHFSECFCEACQAGFRDWLRKRYGDIATLNAAWGTAFWALTFDSFDHVPLAYPNKRPAFPNPCHELDYYRYLSDSLCEFQRQQVEILRKARQDWFITHNGIMQHTDYFKFTEDLDFLGVDVYPGFVVKQPADAWWAAVINQRARSASGSYIIPEQQGGPGGQKPYFHANPQPGQMRLWAYQGIAHGADGVLHFRWRSCRFGAEIYWCGILDHDNIPRRRYEEFSQEGAELKQIGPKLLGTVQEVQAAVLFQLEQEEAQRTMVLGLPGLGQQRDVAFRELWKRHLPCGLVDALDSFDGLELIVMPSMPLMDEQLAGKLRHFVQQGGVLVVTARTATRDFNNQVVSVTPPWLLAEICGATVEEFGRIEPGWCGMTLSGKNVAAEAGYEILKPTTAQAVATWNAVQGHAPFAGEGLPAVTVHKFGKGVAIYVGTFLSDENIADVIDLAQRYAQVAPLARCDGAVEVTRRCGQGRRITFALNHYGQAKAVAGLRAGVDLLSGSPVEGDLTLEPYGVAVIEEN